MPPKKPAADSAEPTVPSPSSDAPVEEKAEAKSGLWANTNKSERSDLILSYPAFQSLRPFKTCKYTVCSLDAAALRKLAAHPSTAIMVKEALKELDSRKGVSSQAIQNYIKQKYPSVDLVRLKHLVRKTLKKGIENGTLVRPANSSVTTGAMGKFRLAPKVKEPKPKTENMDPNVQKAPKPAKDGAKKPANAGATKKKDGASEQAKSQEDSKPSKKSKENEEAATSKSAPVKKPKAKKAAEKGDEKGTSASTKTKAAKATKEAKAGKPSQSKAAKAGSKAPSSKATGKRGKKAE